MSPVADKDKYVVYHGITEGRAEFALYNRDHDKEYDRPEALGGIIAPTNKVPDDIEYMDHFWVELNEDREITALEPAPEMYEQRKDDYQAAAETFDELKERSKRKLDEKNDK